MLKGVSKVEPGYAGGDLENPSYEKVRGENAGVHTARLVPIYPLTEGITQKQIRFLNPSLWPRLC